MYFAERNNGDRREEEEGTFAQGAAAATINDDATGCQRRTGLVVACDSTEDVGHPGTVEGGRNDVRRAGWGAQDDEVQRVVDVGDPVGHHPSEVILRGDAVDRVFRDRVHGLAARDPDLDRAEFVEIA